MKEVLRVPSPNTLPVLVWVNLMRVEDHDQAGWSAVSGICLGSELFRQLEVVLDGAGQQRLLEEQLAHRRREAYSVVGELSHVDCVRGLALKFHSRGRHRRCDSRRKGRLLRWYQGTCDQRSKLSLEVLSDPDLGGGAGFTACYPVEKTGVRGDRFADADHFVYTSM